MPLPVPVRRAALVSAVLSLLVFGTLLSEGSPSGLFARGPFSADFFDEQADSLLDGRLDVDPERVAIEGFEHDGRTHLYFGLFPSILRMPIAAVTDELDGRLTQVSMLVALTVALWASTRLVWRGRAWHRMDDRELRRWEPAVVGAFVAAVGLASPLLFLSSRPVVYHEVELWGTATTLVALDRLLAWWDEPTAGRLALASGAALVALNTRASVGGGAVAALALVSVVAVLWRRVGWQWLPGLALSVLVPVAAYATVNVARFDSLFSVPFEEQVVSKVDGNRQATLESTGGGLFGLEFAPTALVTYLRPDGVTGQRLFPWITFRESTAVIGDPVFDTIDRSASLPVVAPAFLGMAVVGVVALLRRRGRDPWLPAAIGAAMGLASTLTIAFIANRYLADFTPVLVLLAVLGVWVTADALAVRPPRARRLGAVGLVIVTGGSAVVSLALTLQGQRLLILPDDGDRRGFVGLQYDLDGLFRDGPPPSVHRDELPAAPGPRGRITLVADCRALYWSDGRTSFPLEVGEDLAVRLTGPIRPGTTTLVDGRGWSVEVERRGEDAEVSYVPGGRGGEPSQTGRPLGVDDAASTELTLTTDPVNGQLVVRIGDELALRAWPVPVGGPLVPDPAWKASRNPTPLCDQLRAGLER